MAAPTRPNNNKTFMTRLLPGPRFPYVMFHALVFNGTSVREYFLWLVSSNTNPTGSENV